MQEAFDLVVKGGVVVSPSGRGQLDVYVHDGKVAALEPPKREMAATRTVDAGGLLVLPGMVDTHVHLMDPGDVTREDFPTGTLAAGASGVTTIIEHTHGWPVTTPERLVEKRAHVRGRSYVDYGLAAHVWDDPGQDLVGLWRGGVSFFKVFTCATHGVPAQTHDRLTEVFELLADLGAPALVHCEDDQITSASERRLHEAGRSDPGILPAWRSLPAELVAVGTVALLARLAGARVTIAHVSSPAVLEVLRAEQRRGSPAVAETCPQYLLLHEREVYEHGALRKFTPPARARCTDDADEMWRALNKGTIHLLSSDHAPSTREQKLGGDIWQAPFGLPGLDTTFRLLLDAALTGRTSLERVVSAYALAPARRYRLAGKGRLAPGADADMVLVDPGARGTITDEAVRSKAGWTPYAGRGVRGSVVSVLLRGAAIVDDGQVVGAPSGRFMAGPGTTAVS
ncbi:MAG: dihydroorotase [Acidimicrobiales bacterium]